MKNHEVTFRPSGRKVVVSEGTTVLEAARLAGEAVDSPCGGLGTCGKCRIRILSPQTGLPAASSAEAVHLGSQAAEAGYRLACRLEVRQPLVVESAGDTTITKVRGVLEKGLPLAPAVRILTVKVAPHAAGSSLSDAELLLAALKTDCGLENLKLDLSVLRTLPEMFRKADRQVAAAIQEDRGIIAVFPAARLEAFGLAVDVGTTTMAAYLCSLADGRIMAAHSLLNPQVAFGQDVISRIAYAAHHADGPEKLHQTLLEGLNRLIETLCERADVDPSFVLEAVIVGNTVMHHLLLGLDPSQLGASPFPPVLRHPLDVAAREVGLAINPSANVHLLPVKAGFLGADIVAALLAAMPDSLPQPLLIIDVGTNGEMVLADKGRLLAASCATGPALEGAHIRFGMRAAPGAIERVRIDAQTGEVSFMVIGGNDRSSAAPVTTARGICGSGIIDTVSELRRTGIIDSQGAFRQDRQLPRLRSTNGLYEYVLAWRHETSLEDDITISQKDVRNVQLAKAALYAGAKLLMRRLKVEHLSAVVLAGAFGSFIDKRAALQLGMFPDCDPAHIFSLGNAAGQGAIMALLDRRKRREAAVLADRLDYVDLTQEPGFEEEFLAALAIPHARDPFPHLGEATA